MNCGEYDYIVVGAGSAGCVLAGRLSEDVDVRVLVLEAGGTDRNPLIHIPIGLGKLWKERLHDWGYNTEPQEHLNQRTIAQPRGKVLGGSSSINAMVYVRGHSGDYDRWARSGLTGWSYAEVLPWFKRTETWQGGESELRGGCGPIGTCFSESADPIIDAVLDAAREAGFPYSDDINGAVQEGFARTQWTIARGRRASAAVGYLRPAMRRRNLTVQTGALATRVLVAANRARGVEYLYRGRTRRVHAAREVLLAAGAINSPQLLMLSGIGDAGRLRAHKIELLQHLPGVGANLQDHPVTRVAWSRRGNSPLRRALRIDRIGIAMLHSYFAGRGPASAMPGGVMALLRSRMELPVPDIQLAFRGIAQDARPWLPGAGPDWDDAFIFLPTLLHPESRGTVAIDSADPARPARIQPNFLSTPGDLKALCAGIRATREVVRQPPLEAFRGDELYPGAKVTSDHELIAYLRATASTLHHPAGTCRMGSDELAVVDPELRVRGIERLRVVDASVMPDLVSGNINACVLMIAERASHLIRGSRCMEPEPRRAGSESESK